MPIPVNYIDLILIAIMGLSVFNGWKKGFINSFIEIVIWLGSFLTALVLSVYISKLSGFFFGITALWIRPLSFILMLVISSRIIFMICDRLSDGVSEETHEHLANKAAGILPGLLSGILYASLLSFFLISYPVGDATKKAQESTLAAYMTKKPKWLEGSLSNVFNDLGYQLSSTVTIRPEGTQLVHLPFKTHEIRLRKDLEFRMLGLINRERNKQGLNQLEFDEELAKVARNHSEDMFERGYFSHYTPEGKSPFDRIRKGKIRFRIAGENLALAQTLELAHEGLMDSPTHKANILHEAFGRVGIGIQDGGIYGIIVTQNFKN